MPEQMKPVAYNGIAGDFAKKIADHTEADPDAILFQTLVMAGSVLGRGATCEHIAGQPQPLNLYLGVIGAPGDGRKSTSYRVAEALFARIDPDWKETSILPGLSSGEGLLERMEHGPEKAHKRTLVYLDELSRYFAVARREGNTLTPVLLELFERDQCSIATRKNPIFAAGVHLSLIGLSAFDSFYPAVKNQIHGDGLLSRFLWCVPYRTKMDATGGDSQKFRAVMETSAPHFAKALKRKSGTLRLSTAGKETYQRFYQDPFHERGKFGSLLNRRMPHTLRIATLFAILARKNEIGSEHLEAAIEIWDYSRRCVEHLFNAAIPETSFQRSISKVLALLRTAGSGGMTRSDIHNQALNGNATKEDLEAILIATEDRIESRRETNDRGKPRTRYFLKGMKPQ